MPLKNFLLILFSSPSDISLRALEMVSLEESSVDVSSILGAGLELNGAVANVLSSLNCLPSASVSSNNRGGLNVFLRLLLLFKMLVVCISFSGTCPEPCLLSTVVVSEVKVDRFGKSVN